MTFSRGRFEGWRQGTMYNTNHVIAISLNCYKMTWNDLISSPFHFNSSSPNDKHIPWIITNKRNVKLGNRKTSKISMYTTNNICLVCASMHYSLLSSTYKKCNLISSKSQLKTEPARQVVSWGNSLAVQWKQSENNNQFVIYILIGTSPSRITTTYNARTNWTADGVLLLHLLVRLSLCCMHTSEIIWT